ncbi:MAG: glycosyltransferase family 2 protein [Gemmatimonadetes bacterium]|nr:MAG: glycosyltransferase family 2 protein [Gemmatimonadota bacterium]
MKPDKLPLSVVIITLNEEKNLPRCLKHVQWAEEIVVVDSGSTDRTVEIARKYTDKVIYHPFENYVIQKNVATKHASFDWVLSLDADEVVTPELYQQIKRIWLSQKEQYQGFTVNRLSQFLGKWIRHSGWYPDRKIRLFHRHYGRWVGDQVHEHVQITGKIGHLNADLLHYTYDSIEDNLNRMQRYAQLSAQEKFKNGKQTSVTDLTLRPFIKFIKAYIVKQGFRDGLHGLVLCLMGSFYVFLKYANLWELHLAPRKNHDTTSG